MAAPTTTSSDLYTHAHTHTHTHTHTPMCTPVHPYAPLCIPMHPDAPRRTTMHPYVPLNLLVKLSTRSRPLRSRGSLHSQPYPRRRVPVPPLRLRSPFRESTKPLLLPLSCTFVKGSCACGSGTRLQQGLPVLPRRRSPICVVGCLSWDTPSADYCRVLFLSIH